MTYYTASIPATLAEKLKEKGMPIRYEQTDEGIRPMTMFCEVFDWLMSNRRITLVVEPSFYEPYLGKVYNKDGFVKGFDGKTWHEAADAAIEKAIELLKD